MKGYREHPFERQMHAAEDRAQALAEQLEEAKQRLREALKEKNLRAYNNGLEDGKLAGDQRAEKAEAMAAQLREALEAMLIATGPDPKPCGHIFACICAVTSARAALSSDAEGAKKRLKDKLEQVAREAWRAARTPDHDGRLPAGLRDADVARILNDALKGGG